MQVLQNRAVVAIVGVANQCGIPLVGLWSETGIPPIGCARSRLLESLLPEDLAGWLSELVTGPFKIRHWTWQGTEKE